MFSWLKRDIECSGTVFFRGTLSPRLEEFTQFNIKGLKITKRPPVDNAAWSADLEFAGIKATLIALKEFSPVPEELLAFDPRLTDEDRAAARSAGTWVSVMCSGTRQNVLRDRKIMLRFLRLVMGEDGLIALDHTGEKFWSREMLDDELQHDADLDIDSIFITHCIYADGDEDKEEKRTEWLHTHGLDKVGGIDFDVLNPAPALMENGYDTIRALAYGSLEHGAKLKGDVVPLYAPGAPVQLVPVEEFNARCPESLRAMRGDPRDEVHNKNRVICCDVVKKRLFGLLPAAVRPHRGLQTVDGERMVAHFPNAATELMADRARKTFALFRKFREEFADLEAMPIVKLGFAVDGATAPDQREHMWFEVHELGDDSVDATLRCQPYNISSMKDGDRGWHGIDKLTDWTLITPAGWLTPRNLSTARILRKNRDTIRTVLDEVKKKAAE